MGRFKNSHRRALEFIAVHPEVFRISDVLASSIEMNLYDTQGRLIAQPDVVFLLPKSHITIIEYKTTEIIKNGQTSSLKKHTDGLKGKAMSQLQ